MLQLLLAKISFLGVVPEVCRAVRPCVSPVQTLQYEYP